ncbi:hypothetical protein ALC56_04460 [Trachymyrmex septentrionalis]|uniref:Uncharacterized protein n=1 Tax=Trachymyrmex septentrionalis TaxID=34720 RepID=A0A195FN25_9HYME|nr:hypothetical protein ALC56_04460 [Trachymyrmex septentrionalis]
MPKSMNTQSMPSFLYSSCSSTNIWWLKNCCNFSLVKLMQSCSKPLYCHFLRLQCVGKSVGREDGTESNRIGKGRETKIIISETNISAELNKCLCHMCVESNISNFLKF